MQTYNHQAIEQAAQRYWQDNKSFEAFEDDSKEKYYCLSMFPYPSGRLHMGHVRNYSIGDTIARFQKMQGKNVLQPIGWDGFGLPAENAALKNQLPPAKWTYENINTMKTQLKQLGFGYDWSRELATCHPNYYRWEQWLFVKLFDKGLVYKKNAVVNWDPVDQTVLANEQVIDGRGWRSNALVEKKEIAQWFMRITDYAEELLSGLDQLSGWPESVKTMQKNWIGKSVGLEIDFSLADGNPLKVYTTRPDTLMGVTYLAIAPEHPLAIIAGKNNADVQAFINECKAVQTTESALETMEKKGIDSALTCIHPITGTPVPIWIANFVLMGYGTGAVMSVPAHDQRDYTFAKQYNIAIKQVINQHESIDETAITDKGILFNSGVFDGLDFDQAFAAIAQALAAKNLGTQQTNYRLRDWGVSRQRYWGCPIPMINCQSCGSVPVPEADLPVLLPEAVNFDGVSSPLKKMTEFYHTSCPKCGADAQRETDTFDTFFESSWYFARYACSDNHNTMLDERANYWLTGGIEQYIGGIEHAILHLLYARFFNKLLRDEGLIKNDEPFKNLLTQGMVLKDGTKMSKSKGNTVDPSAMIEKYGADTVRTFILFAAPPAQDLEWSNSGLEGANRFVNKVYRLCMSFIKACKNHPIGNLDNLTPTQKNLRQKAHQTLAKITDDLARRYAFNTAIAALMALSNALLKFNQTDAAAMAVRQEAIEILLKTLSPITPHLCHHLWQALGHTQAIINEPWPNINTDALAQDQLQIMVQVNGKLRGKIITPVGADNASVEAQALADEQIVKFTADKNIVKIIVVANKLVNIVVA